MPDIGGWHDVSDDRVPWAGIQSSEQLIGPHSVRLWAAEVTPQLDLKPYEALLSEAERDRADRFRTKELRSVYVAAHGTLRQVLSTYLRRHAHEVVFQVNEWGKPHVSHAESGGPHFNLSHSKNFFLIGVSTTSPVGVDIEWIAPEAPFHISEDVFTGPELSWIYSHRPSERRIGFYDLWVRKEAVLKAIGQGLAMNVRSIDTTSEFICIDGYSFVSVQNIGQSWIISDIKSVPGFAAALAVRGSSP